MIKTLIVEGVGALFENDAGTVRKGAFSAIGKITTKLNCNVALLLDPKSDSLPEEFLVAALQAEVTTKVSVVRSLDEAKEKDAGYTVFISGSENCVVGLARGFTSYCLGPCAGEGVNQVNDWNELYRLLVLPLRKAEITRNTAETRIHAVLDLEGKGKAQVATGLGFFDHMLELFTRHSGVDLALKVDGDLHVDEHHTVEDTAIVLGQAFAKCLTDKAGLERYGFVLPMDESHATVAIDFSGRSDLIWKAEFSREKVGDMPTEMFRHFFKAFCDNCHCNILIDVQGENEHHKIEAVFKGLARAIRQAIRRDPDDPRIPSTKELL